MLVLFLSVAAAWTAPAPPFTPAGSPWFRAPAIPAPLAAAAAPGYAVFPAPQPLSLPLRRTAPASSASVEAFMAAAVPAMVAALAMSGRQRRARTPVMQLGRRNFLAQSSALAAGFTLSSAPALASSAPDYAGAKAALQAMIKEDPDVGPTMVRLAWHSSGTYDTMSKTGGSGGGTIRFKEELAHGGNAGLDKMVAKLEPLKGQFPGISYADLYTLAGATAIEAAGVKVPWRAGRVDAMTPDAVTPDGRLPDASKGNDPQKTAAALRTDVFYRMGFNDQEIVVLSGAHALGRCHPDASGYSGPWSNTPYSLNNGYFNLLLRVPWTIKEWDGPMQFEDPTGKLMMLPSDLALVQDKKFRKFVELYAKDNALFTQDFTTAYTKLTELGTKNLKTVNL